MKTGEMWRKFAGCLKCLANPAMPCVQKYNREVAKMQPCRDRPLLPDVLPGDEELDYNGTKMKARDIPAGDKVTRAMMGVGHHNPFGRQVIPGNYAWTPDTCELTEPTGFNRWIRKGTILICTGCGLDCT